MNVGSYIFSQVMDYIPRYQFDKLVAKYHGNWHSKDLTCYNQLLHLLFGQITGCGSLRDICLCLEAHKPILYHLGFRNTVTQPSLFRANENRDYRIYEGLGTYLISIVRPLYSKTAIPEITVDNVLYALDSTTISTSIKLATWALGKYSKGGVKMHTLLDLRGSIPANIHITHGRWHDSNELDIIEPEPYAFYMMDKAYVDFDALFRFHLAGAYWVTRPKENMKSSATGACRMQTERLVSQVTSPSVSPPSRLRSILSRYGLSASMMKKLEKLEKKSCSSQITSTSAPLRFPAYIDIGGTSKFSSNGSSRIS